MSFNVNNLSYSFGKDATPLQLQPSDQPDNSSESDATGTLKGYNSNHGSSDGNVSFTFS